MTLPPITDAMRDDARESSAEHADIVQLCQDASVEMTIHDALKLQEVATLLPAASRVFISHLPRQSWQETVDAAVAVNKCGLTPVPHVPVRQIASARELDQLLEQVASEAGVNHVLLIAGDRAQPAGPFACSSDVLRTGVLEQHGITRVSMAAHPEGHPQLSSEVLRASELEKIACAERAGLDAGFVTQFAFDSAPIVEWASELRVRGVRNAIRIGLAGPARLPTLLQYALRCGIGPSIRALTGHGAALGRLLGERGPEDVVRDLARARNEGLEIEGIHLFCFGGLLRTCRWIRDVAEGRFTLDEAHGFTVDEPA